MAKEFSIKRGDTKPSITSTLEDGDLNPVDINGAEVSFIMREQRGAKTVVINAPADNLQNGDGTDGSMGKVRYQWQVGDTDDLVPEGSAGEGYQAEWEVIFADLGVGSFPNGRNSRIAVYADIGDAGS